MGYEPSANLLKLQSQQLSANDQQKAIKTLQKILELSKQQTDLLRTIPNGWLTQEQYRSLIGNINDLQKNIYGIK